MKLEKGMSLWEVRTYKKYIITRVTETQAIAERKNITGAKYEIRFYREQLNPSHIKPRGSSVYSYDFYSVETPEIVEKYQLRLLRNRITKIDMTGLSSEQMIKMLAILEGKE